MQDKNDFDYQAIRAKRRPTPIRFIAGRQNLSAVAPKPRFAISTCGLSEKTSSSFSKSRPMDKALNN